jgi:ubiquitin-protein ligase
MIFDTEMWHPNVYNSGNRKGEVCVSILVSCLQHFEADSSTHRARTSGDTRTRASGGSLSTLSRVL